MNCPKCDAAIGELHEYICDVARCKHCGGQYFQCEYFEMCENPQNTIWQGEWPGVVECREFGWYTTPDSIWGVMEDLNRLLSSNEVEWDRTLERYVPRVK